MSHTNICMHEEIYPHSTRTRLSRTHFHWNHTHHGPAGWPGTWPLRGCLARLLQTRTISLSVPSGFALFTEWSRWVGEVYTYRSQPTLNLIWISKAGRDGREEEWDNKRGSPMGNVFLYSSTGATSSFTGTLSRGMLRHRRQQATTLVYIEVTYM